MRCGAVTEFYMSDVRNLLRCQGSMAEQRQIMVVGSISNETKTFNGLVQAIFEDAALNVGGLHARY